MNLVCAVVLLLAAAGAGKQVDEVSAPTRIDRAFSRLYNFDFQGALAILDDYSREHPDDPLAYSVRASACLFSEFHRLKILEADFFSNDDKVTDKKKLKPDPAMRTRLFEMTGEARKRAALRLAVNPNDSNAMLALCMAAGIETDYESLVEKKYLKSYSLSKESQKYAHQLLALNPPMFDAYLTLGSVEYVVGNLNFFFRLFIRFDQINGSKEKAVENLKKVITSGRYFGPFAKILLSVIYLREKQPQRALVLLKEMERDYPENPLFKKEVILVSERIAREEEKDK